MRRSSKSTEMNRRRFLRNSAGWALGAGGILVPRLIRASAFTENVTQYLGAQPAISNHPYMPEPASLTGWWILSGDGNDYSGNGANLTFGATPNYAAGQNGGLSFQAGAGTGQTYAFTSAPACNGWTSFSCSFWFLQAGFGTGAGRFFEKGANNEITFCGQTTLPGQGFYAPLGGSAFANTFTDIIGGVWANYVITGIAGSTQQVYGNGSLLVSGTGGTPSSPTGSIYFCTYGGSPGSFQMGGNMQDVRFWKNVVLTSTEISNLFAAGAAFHT